jgi:hypothetical protein
MALKMPTKFFCLVYAGAVLFISLRRQQDIKKGENYRDQDFSKFFQDFHHFLLVDIRIRIRSHNYGHGNVLIKCPIDARHVKLQIAPAISSRRELDNIMRG